MLVDSGTTPMHARLNQLPGSHPVAFRKRVDVGDDVPESDAYPPQPPPRLCPKKGLRRLHRSRPFATADFQRNKGTPGFGTWSREHPQNPKQG